MGSKDHALIQDSSQGTPAISRPLSQGFQFECPLTVFKADSAPEGKQRRIAGIISTDSVDKQNERILQDGLDFSSFVREGWLNDNHGGSMTDVLGFPEAVSQFSKGDILPDGQTAPANCHWVEGYLLDTPKATQIWQLACALSKTKRRLGFSVEGDIQARTGDNDSVITKANVRHVAVTHVPVNSQTVLDVLARSMTAQTAMLRRSMTITDASGSAGPVKPNRPYTGQGAGQVLTPEHLQGAKPKRKKPRTMTRKQAAAYVKSVVPGLPEVLVRAIIHRTLHPQGRK